jgi:hexosaminidase
MNKKLIFLLPGIFIMSTQTYNQAQVQLIPKPQELKVLDGNFVISQDISFNSSNVNDNLLKYLMDYLTELYGTKFTKTNREEAPSITLQIDKDFSNTKPEAYSLKINPDRIKILASSEVGLFFGIQTLFQILPKNISGTEMIKIQSCEITDYARFTWRGLNLDCCRHFMTKDFIKRYIDILSYYKFNVLHWHLTEDQGWRIEIKKYPKLTEVGAWRKEADGSTYGGYYTQEDIKEIVAYAQSRFITIVPEIEMPGHSLASLASYPENSCTGGPFEVTNMWGVMKDVYCAGRDSTFYFLQDILDEVIQLFPGEYIHIGGDEVPKDRWKECPKCQARIKANGLKDEHELQSYFIKRISNYLVGKGKKVIGWDEILQGGLAPGAVVQSWQSFQGAIDAARLGHYVICSPASHTYLNADPEDLDLRIAYSFEPVPDELSADEEKFILGGEVNLWTERAPQETVDSKLFPRILALAEVFWTDPQSKNYDEFYTRVQAAYSDLTARGIEYGRESKVITPSISYNADKKEFTVTIIQGQKNIDIRYTENGSEPDFNSMLYSEPIKANKSIKLKIAAFRDNHFIGRKVALMFDFHKALNSKITLANKYNERYRGGGENGLIDGVRGTDDFHDGLWQGFEGVDFEAIIDLGEEKEISKVTPRFILNSNSWIFLPNKVEITLSKDNVNYSDEKIIVNDVPQKNSEIILKDFPANFNMQSARYLKVKAESIKKCPEWHPGAGGNAWVFIDEIVVE